MKQITYLSPIDHNDKLKLNFITVPLEILCYFNNDQSKSRYNLRVLISINGCKPWHGGVVALGNNSGYITVKNDILKSLKVKLDEIVSVSLTEDLSEYGMEFPEELAELLLQDTIANNRFKALKLSAQRYLIYNLLQIKKSEKRIEKAIKMMELLKSYPEGKEDIKAILKVK